MPISRFVCAGVLLGLVLASAPAVAQTVDLTQCTIVVRGHGASDLERTAATVLAEEIELRTGLKWPVAESWPTEGAAVAVVAGDAKKLDGTAVPKNLRTGKAEGYAIVTDTASGRPMLWLLGADARGALYGVGKLLRSLEWRQGSVQLAKPLDTASAPAYAIRGHQLGYRATANSYDAWSPQQYDRYIRELALFGANSIEAIPSQDPRPTPVMKFSRAEMNRAIAESCQRYGMDYWAWMPAVFDLNDTEKRADLLDRYEQLFADTPGFDAVFFPGGDPGDNPPEFVVLYLEDLAVRLAKHHPDAKIWVSLQGFDDHMVDAFFEWLNERMPSWMGGLVAGPSSPPIPDLRARLPRQYGLRDYPDITHIVRAQYCAHWLDPAFAFTIGREPVNPRPLFYKAVHQNTAPYTNGFLSYSDGIHDDLNKAVWSALGWDPNADMREAVLDYGRFFFGADAAQPAADAILALERNLEGPLAPNGSVDGTLAQWQAIETAHPELLNNWRFQLHLVRAYYDAFVRHRLIHESALEQEANALMAQATTLGADAAMDVALAALKRADTEPVKPEWRQRIVDLCDALFNSIGFQTSVEKYHASGRERGAVLDFIDYPLNNRWWLEDELAKARALPSEAEKCAALQRLATWENPGPGSFYDDIGNVAKSPHVIRGEQVNTALDAERMPVPDFMWWEEGRTRVRQSWLDKMDWPLGMRYQGIDPEASYTVRTTGNGDCYLRVNSERIAPTLDGREVGEIKEFPIPKRLYRNGVITLTFDAPFEPGINWRKSSRLTEVWLIKN